MIVIKLVGKLSILLSIQLFCSKLIFVKSITDLFSKFKILLLNIKDLKSKNQIKFKLRIKNKLKKIKNLNLNLNLKVSLEAKEVIYINKINIPPIKIKNRE